MAEDISKNTTEIKFKELEYRLTKHYAKRGTRQYDDIATIIGKLRMMFIGTKDSGNCGDVNERR